MELRENFFLENYNFYCSIVGKKKIKKFLSKLHLFGNQLISSEASSGAKRQGERSGRLQLFLYREMNI